MIIDVKPAKIIDAGQKGKKAEKEEVQEMVSKGMEKGQRAKGRREGNAVDLSISDPF